MGRKKKGEAEKKKGKGKESDSQEFHLENILGSDAKRSIASVFLFTFALLFLLSFFEAAGIAGKWLESGSSTVLGYGKWLFPILLFLSGLFFLKRQTTTLADAVKFIGLLIAFFSVLGLLHLFMGDTNKELLKVAKAGEGGGFVGYALSYIFLNLTGKIAGVILLVGLFSAGVIAAFNVSLIHFLEHLKEKMLNFRKTPVSETEDGAEEIGERIVSSETAFEAPLPETLSTPVVEALEENNIRNLKFKDEEEEEKEEEGDKNFSEIPILATNTRRPRKRPAYYWELPPVDFLDSKIDQAAGGDTARCQEVIIETLKNFGISVEPGGFEVGPTVTQYTFRPSFGVKLSRITALSDNLALALAARSIRIQAPIPGQSLVGIEIPNESVAMVRLRRLLESKEFKNRKSNLSLILGESVNGKPLIADLGKMPHLLIAGRSGSGKSVCVNSLLVSLLYQNSPEDLKLILVDPKRVELSRYRNIPHLKSSVIVEMKKVVGALRWAVGEMEHRYKLLEPAHARDIEEYREKCLRGETKTIVDPDTNKVREERLDPLPYVVIVIDEMADLMGSHGKEVEPLIVRITAMSRAVGIHLILATQRPEVTVITGLIKANIPARIAFQMKSQIDSRTILDTGGAEKLLGNGDMLYSPPDGSEPKRLQGVYVSSEEVDRVMNFLRAQKEELGDDETADDFDEAEDAVTLAMDAMDEGSKEDDLYEQAKRIVVETGRASTTYLQTALGVGYPRGARLMHLLEQNGIVGLVDGKKKVLVGKADESSVESLEAEPKAEEDPVREQMERDKWQL
ncbi:MAG: DNA translocase FtsK 4TM domain-containing protein [Patescibacteria group bacterium]